MCHVIYWGICRCWLAYMPSGLSWTPHELPHTCDSCRRNRCEALAGVIAYHTLSCSEICMPRYHWFMCRMLFSVFSLKITLQSCLEQTYTKPQQTCCLPSADGNLPIMWNCWKPTWAIWKCEVCTNGMCFVSYPPFCSYHVYNLLKLRPDLQLFCIAYSCSLVFLCNKWLHS